MAWARDFARGFFGKASERDPLGPLAEKAAARYLRSKRFRILGGNLRVRCGEADLLAIDPDRVTIVLVEVKARRVPADPSVALPPPEAAVHAHKQDKLRDVLRELRAANGWMSRPARIDVVAIDWSDSGAPAIRHWPGAVPLTKGG